MSPEAFEQLAHLGVGRGCSRAIASTYARIISARFALPFPGVDDAQALDDWIAALNQIADIAQRRKEASRSCLLLFRKRAWFCPLISLSKITHCLCLSLTADCFKTLDMQAIGKYARQTALIDAGARVERGEKFKRLKLFQMEWLGCVQRQRGLTIQRTRAREMNPDQLWETTMNPETRRASCVY